MRKLKGILVLILLLALLASPIAVLASDISGAKYYGTIIVSNNSTATTNVAVNCTISTSALIDGGYLNSSANNCVIRSSAGADLPFMPSVNASYPWCIWVPSIGQNTHLADILYTANSTGGKIRYFPAAGGMRSIDSLSMELGDNWSIEQKGWVDTSYTFTKAVANFETFIEVDANSKLTVTATKATAVDADRDENVYLYKDEGVDYFDALDIDFEIYLDTNSLTDGLAGVAFANLVGDITDFGTTEPSVFMSQGTPIVFSLARGALTASDSWVGASADTPYYCTIYREAGSDSANCTIYSDLTRETLLDTLIVAGYGTTKWRYVYGFINYNNGTTGKDFDGYVQDLAYERNPVLVQKGGAFKTYIGATGNITSATLAEEVSVSGISSNEIKVVTTADSSNITLSVYDANDVLLASDTTVLSANITDNANDWEFCLNDSIIYLEYQTISVNGTQVQYIDWEYDTTFHDSSGFDNDATPTFRTTSSDPDVSAVLSSFLPIAEAKAPGYALEDAPAFIETTPTIVSEWDVTPPAGTFPLAGVITAIASATDTPAQLPLLIIAAFVIIACSLAISATMRRYGSGSLIVKSLVITALMGVFIALGNFGIDFWMLFVFLVIAIALSMGSKQVGWQ